MKSQKTQALSLTKKQYILTAAIMELKKNKYLYLFLLPCVVYFVVYRYLPMVGLVIAFKEFNFAKGIWGGEWVGLKYFKFIFTEHKEFYSILRNTLLINLYKIAFGFPVPIIIALMINEVKNIKLKKIIQSSAYLPYFVSWVVFGGIIIQFLSPSTGIVNEIIRLFGGQPIFFMTEEKYFRSIVVISDIWKTAGWNTIIYLAAITSLDPNLYEAAYIDGANKFRQIWHITLPGISETIVVLLLLNIGTLLAVGFEQIYVLYNPTVYSVGDVISTYVYRVGIGKGRFSLTTAIGLFQSVVGLVLISVSNFTVKKLFDKSLW
jgi:putative aldouronate transport system permease protein